MICDANLFFWKSLQRHSDGNSIASAINENTIAQSPLPHCERATFMRKCDMNEPEMFCSVLKGSFWLATMAGPSCSAGCSPYAMMVNASSRGATPVCKRNKTM